MLQFGHGTDAVDDPRVRPPVACRRRWGFNSATALTPWMTAVASFGPAEIRRLQFGHGTDAVDDNTLPGAKLVNAALQFGHGTDAVDDRLPEGKSNVGEPRFNSATALTPWMTSHGRTGSSVPCSTLQ